MSSRLSRASLVIAVCLVVACSGSRPRAPVISAGATTGPVYDQYVVSRGDTLFSIAWRYGMDFRKLANANSIGPPYTIFPNQKLVLREQEATVPRSKPSAKPAPRPTSGSTPGAGASRTGTVARVQQPAAAGISVPSKDPDGWQWPAPGPVVRTYGADGAHKGIDIDGKLGEPVRSAAPGTVVYAGDGILGYGNLLIVKHSDQYLSAYGHNDRLLVREGTRVDRGQVIAEIGDSGTNSVKLHFEIRKSGKPVDPLKYLPPPS